MHDEPMNFIQPSTPPPPPSSPHSPRRRLFLIILILLATGLVGGCITRGLAGKEAPEDPAAYDPVTLEPKKPEGLLGKIKHLVFHNEIDLDGEKHDRTNILLLGQGGPGHDGPFLTDTIIIISLKPSTGQVAFISIPRDLAVQIPGQGTRKINHANAFGEVQKKNFGPALTASVIKETFDLDIHYYLRVDFTAFEDIVDEIGGITVNVDTPFVDEQYPASNFEYQVVSFTKGPQTMDGDTALKFVRSRHGNNGEGSDFARSVRQQKVLLAFKEKVLSFQTLTNPVRINNIFNSLEKHVVTNMQFSDMIAFLKTIKEFKTESIHRLTLDDSEDGLLTASQTAEGAFVLQPKSGNYDEISRLIETIFDQPVSVMTDDTPTQTEPAFVYGSATIEVQNGTWNAGLAARIGKRLTDKGFSVSSIGNTVDRPLASSGIFIIHPETVTPEIVDGLQSIVRAPVKKEPPENEKASTSNTHILILLGEDFNE